MSADRSDFPISSQRQTDHTNMFNDWILFSALLLGTGAFMVHNKHHGLCLEDSVAAGEVLLNKCNLGSEAQQWIWINHGMLMSVATSRCLPAKQPFQTQSCRGWKMDAAELMWDCDRDLLISRNTSMLLSIDGQRLTLTHDTKNSEWRSLDEADICQEKLRSRRATDNTEEFEATGEQAGEQAAMTEEQREYLRWFYRTEDPTMWKFVMLGMAFVCLLIGFLLLGMGAMANRNRKEIAKYKAAAALVQKSDCEELLVVSPPGDNSSKLCPSLDSLLQERKASPSNGEASDLKAGDIMVTWKNGNTSCLYSESATEDKHDEVSASELEADEAANRKPSL